MSSKRAAASSKSSKAKSGPKKSKKADNEATSEKKSDGHAEPRNAPGELCWTTIPVGDVERAARFYSEVFDWKFERWGPTTTFTTPSLAGKHSGHLGVKERLTFPLPWVNVSDIGAALKKIKSAGGEIVEKESNIDPEGKVGLQAVFKDSEGNLLKLYRHSEKK